MREIKFRAKRIGNNEWVTGEPHMKCCTPHIHTGEAKTCLIDKKTLGQFTGLRDKNGNEIYEGDVVCSDKYSNIKHTIIYDDKYASFMAVCIDRNTGSEFETRCHITQEWIDKYPKYIIGNIHDNPELIKDE